MNRRIPYRMIGTALLAVCALAAAPALAADEITADNWGEKVGFKPLGNPEKWMYLRLDLLGAV